MLKASNHIIGGTATLAAVVVPDALLSYGGKLLFALIAAALSSLVSALVSNHFRKPK